MKLLDVAPQLLGKRIAGVVVKERSGPPRFQLFLVFDDDTYYELYSNESVSGAGGIDRGGVAEVLNYMSDSRVVLKTFIDPFKGVQTEIPL